MAARAHDLQAIDGPYLQIQRPRRVPAGRRTLGGPRLRRQVGAAPRPDRRRQRGLLPAAGRLRPRREHPRRLRVLHLRAGGATGAVMLGDEMIDEASRKMALVISGKGRAAGMSAATCGRRRTPDLPYDPCRATPPRPRERLRRARRRRGDHRPQRRRGRARRALRRPPDLVVLAAPRRSSRAAAATVVPWPPGACAGSSTARRGCGWSRTSPARWSTTRRSRLGDAGTGRIAVVNDRGPAAGHRQVAAGSSQTFDTRSAEHVAPLLDAIEEVLAALAQGRRRAVPRLRHPARRGPRGPADRSRQRRRPRLRQRAHATRST